MKHRIIAVSLLAQAILLIGCSSSGPATGSAVARLEGRVTVDGKAIEVGKIQFLPTGTNSGVAVQAEIVQGRYQAEGVPQGSVMILFHASRATGKMIKEHDQLEPEVINLIPKKYQSGLKLEVTGDQAGRDFDLKD